MDTTVNHFMNFRIICGYVLCNIVPVLFVIPQNSLLPRRSNVSSFICYINCSTIGFILSLVAAYIIVDRKPISNMYSYGYRRFEAIILFINAYLLITSVAYLTASIIYKGLARIPSETFHSLYLASSFGLVSNVIWFWIFFGDTIKTYHLFIINQSYENRNNDIERFSRPKGEISKLKNKFLNSRILIKSVYVNILFSILGYILVLLSVFSEMCQHDSMFLLVYSIIMAFFMMSHACTFIFETMSIFAQDQPIHLRNILPKCYEKIMQLPDVEMITEPHFWTMITGSHIGTLKLKLKVADNQNSKFILDETRKIFATHKLHRLTIELNYAK